MYNTYRSNISDCNIERSPGNNRNRYNSTKKTKFSKSKNAKVDNRMQNCNEQISEFSSLQWNQSNQRLYPTMSDSAVCGYQTVPVHIPVDTRFHTLYPVYQPYVSVGIGREYLEPNQHISSRDQFTSLPPINIIDNESEIKRTHSDPGLNNQEDTFELISSESEQSFDTCYANEVAELKKANQRLSNELELVKIELRNLKLDISSINNDRCVCADPGSITNIIKEIRSAHKLMEQTIESKLNSFNANAIHTNEITNNNSQISSIHERLEKLEKTFDIALKTKSQKMMDLDTKVKHNLKNNDSSKKSSVVTAL